MSDSSAVIFHNLMYNIGGFPSTHSIVFSRLSSHCPPEWRFMDLPNYNFAGFGFREAFVVENRIVYFGSFKKKTTFVLEKE